MSRHIAIKFYKDNGDFAGWFSWSGLKYEYRVKKNIFELIHIRPLTTDCSFFSEEDLQNGVLLEHIKEIISYFNKNENLKKYKVQVINLLEGKELYDTDFH